MSQIQNKNMFDYFKNMFDVPTDIANQRMLENKLIRKNVQKCIKVRKFCFECVDEIISHH